MAAVHPNNTIIWDVVYKWRLSIVASIKEALITAHWTIAFLRHTIVQIRTVLFWVSFHVVTSEQEKSSEINKLRESIVSNS